MLHLQLSRSAMLRLMTVQLLLAALINRTGASVGTVTCTTLCAMPVAHQLCLHEQTAPGASRSS